MQGFTITNNTDDLDLFCWGENGKPERAWEKNPAIIQVYVSSEDRFLTTEQFRKICEMTSAGVELPLEYRLQLEAYRASGAGDFRKAIIEAAAAAEVTLTNAIRAKFDADGIYYGKKLLDKFRMLGGRVELAEALGLNLPDNFKNSLVVPRNEVVHKANFADRTMAYLAMKASDDLIHMQPSTIYSGNSAVRLSPNK